MSHPIRENLYWNFIINLRSHFYLFLLLNLKLIDIYIYIYIYISINFKDIEN